MGLSISDLVALAEKHQWTAIGLQTLFDIPTDRLHGKTNQEIITQAIAEGDNPEWIAEKLVEALTAEEISIFEDLRLYLELLNIGFYILKEPVTAFASLTMHDNKVIVVAICAEKVSGTDKYFFRLSSNGKCKTIRTGPMNTALAVCEMFMKQCR